MSRIGLMVAIFGMLAVTHADAAARWPWEVRQHHPCKHAKPKEQVNPMVDCQQINADLKLLPPAKLKRTLLRSNKKQLETIARCQAEAP